MSMLLKYRLILMLSLLVFPAVARGGNEDTAADTTTILKEKSEGNIINRIISYFEKSNKTRITRRPSISFVGGPYYSSDTKFGVGIIGTTVRDSVLMPE